MSKFIEKFSDVYNSVTIQRIFNYRLKTCVNFQKENNQILPYSDSITDNDLLVFINKFIEIINKFEDIKVVSKYAYFQRSNFYNSYGVIIAFDSFIDENKIAEFYKLNHLLCKIFGYFIINKQQKTKKIIYISEQVRLLNKYYDFDWAIGIESFQQIHPEISLKIHSIVDNMIIDNNYNYNYNFNFNFLGIGGEMGVYAKKFKNFFSKIVCLTNSKTIFDDFKINIPDNHTKISLVNYNEILLEAFIDNSKWILLVNISRHGLGKLASQIKEMRFEKIIYIGCCLHYILIDCKILEERYRINKILKLELANSENFVVEFIEKK